MGESMRHGLTDRALKTSDSVAMVQLGPDWFGYVHSWTEAKKVCCGVHDLCVIC
jgi:hypothetical protein